MTSRPPESSTLRFTTMENQPRPEIQPPNPDQASGTSDRFEAEAARIPDVIGADGADPSAGAKDVTPGAGGWPPVVVRALMELPCDFAAQLLKKDYWRLSQLEGDAWVEAAKPALDKDFPWETLGVWGGPLAVAATIVMPRLLLMKLEHNAEKPGSETPSSATDPFAASSAS